MSSQQQVMLAQKISGGGGGGGSLAITGVSKDVDSGVSVNVLYSGTAGRLLVVALAEYGSTGTNCSVSDNIDGTTGWTKCESGLETGNIAASIWYKKNIPSGITTITGNCGSSGSYPTLIVHEVSGASTTSPFTIGESGNAHGASSNPATPSITNATPDSIFFAIASNGTGSNPATFTLNSSGTVGGTDWAHYAATSRELDGSQWLCASVPNKIASSSAATAHAWTFEGSYNYACVIACFH